MRTEPRAAIVEDGAKAPREVLIVAAKPDLKSVADLPVRAVVLASFDAISGDRLKASFATAGAREVDFKAVAGDALERLSRGEADAAIVGVADPAVAARMQGVPGLRLLLVPLSPRNGD